MKIASFSASTKKISKYWLSDHVDQKQILQTAKLLAPHQIILFHGNEKAKESCTNYLSTQGYNVKAV
jgi:Cft2 family RNA processing exonuclease